MKFDLISLGEPLLRLSPPNYTQIRRATSFDVCVAGSQLNVAANLARLGKKTSLVSKVPDNALGHLVIDSCSSYGVDTANVLMVPRGKLGTTYVEFSASPRAPKAIYDRAGSSASTLGPDDFDWDLLTGETHIAYTDGIFPGLSENCLRASQSFLESAKRNACVTAFDLNFRHHLWTAETARKAWIPLLKVVDVLVTNRDCSERVFGFTGSDEELTKCYANEFGCKTVCLTRRESVGLGSGGWSSSALHDGLFVDGGRVEFKILDRYGTGDAWFAGFLYAFSGHNTEHALSFGNALCGLAHTIAGDVAHVTPEEVFGVMNGSGEPGVRR